MITSAAASLSALPLSLERVSIFQCSRRPRNLGRVIREGFEEIEIVLGGRGSYNLDGQLFPLEAGSMLWHRAGEKTIEHSDAQDPYRCLVIGFRVSGHSTTRQPHLSAWRNAAAAVSFAEELFAAFHRGDIDRQLLCHYAHISCAWQAHAAGPSRANPILPANLRRALQVIAKDFASDLDLPTVAQRAGLSLPHLHSLFRRHLDSTPSKVLEERRLRHARSLLAEGQDPIASIAHTCGFADAGSFCRAFKRRQGMTPGAYRQRYSAPLA
ncbi:MAG: AraC family transcriptional regulator [Planctomycetota bacterium]|nr:MAG: AraC family transcriptional regulator [Planctomycetota bacterium]